ncbi:hypothetical protein CRG98_011697 [Punica granatum]|uniref:Uncharacterized protein n=1 Tax=Punica granatum TaxID=22663 RepID=A0A2I0KI06_PUNGR|nr:hypothetical protein CRG98_011697 [Punica granatum]
MSSGSLLGLTHLPYSLQTSPLLASCCHRGGIRSSSTSKSHALFTRAISLFASALNPEPVFTNQSTRCTGVEFQFLSCMGVHPLQQSCDVLEPLQAFSMKPGIFGTMSCFGTKDFDENICKL